MANKNLVLRPLGGLGNRMLAIASAYTLSKELERPLSVIWERDERLNCPFHLLFNSICNVNVIESHTKAPFLRKIKRRFSHVTFSKVISRESLNQLVAQKKLLSELSSGKNVLIYGAHQFYLIGDLSELFIPTNEIQEKIKGIQKRFSPDMVGIHIRRTDHGPSKEKSPTELFIKKIGEELKQNEKRHFYLSTDDPKEEELLITSYGDRIIRQTKQFNRNSLEGNRDALVDLFCLSLCSKIYGSFYSSFSYTAAQLSGIELITINNSNNPVDHLRHLRKSK